MALCIFTSKRRIRCDYGDSTEPVGPAVKLFESGFYEGISKALKEDGIFVAQTDNPWFHSELITKVYMDVRKFSRLHGCIQQIFQLIQVVFGRLQWGLRSMIHWKLKRAVFMKLKQNITQKIFIRQPLLYLNLLAT